jgi:hypothetical protein
LPLVALPQPLAPATTGESLQEAQAALYIARSCPAATRAKTDDTGDQGECIGREKCLFELNVAYFYCFEGSKAYVILSAMRSFVAAVWRQLLSLHVITLRPGAH